MLTRAYSFLTVKAIDGEKRLITGTATTPTPDRMGDIVEPLGVQFKNPLPLLLYHNSQKPVGSVRFQKPTMKGIDFEASLPMVEEPGAVKDRIDEAWQSLKAGLLTGVSIGFRPLEEAYMKDTGSFRYIQSEVLELSLVAIPANADATIATIKSLDIGLAASGTEADVHHPLPAGVSAATRVVTMRKDSRAMKKTLADQITGFENTRAAKAAQMDAILEKSAEAGTTLDAAEKEQHDTLSTEIQEIDEHLVRLHAAEEREKKAAVPVANAEGLTVRPGARITVTRELPKGYLFARYAMCIGNSRGHEGEALRLAKQHFPDDPGVQRLIEKAAVTGGATSGSHYLDDMVPYNVMNDFIEYLRPGSIIGKFGGPNPGAPGRMYPALRKVGFNERVSGMSTGYTAAWKGEGLPALPSAAVTFNTSLTWNCMSALAVLTKESIRFSNPNAEEVVRRDLAAAVNGKLDNDFVDPAKAASSTTSPASITNAVIATAPSGTAPINVRHDIAAILAAFAASNLSPSNVVLIMSGSIAAQLSMMINSLGVDSFPDLTLDGGYLLGYPVIVSEFLTALGSPSTQMIVAVKADEVYLADDGVVTVEASDQASIEMQDTSSASAISGTGASLVSLWQTGAIGLLANREITWKLRRSAAVHYLSPCAYVVPTS